MTTTPKKKLIEVSLPLEALNRAAENETRIRSGHPKAIHQWWSRKPLPTARAVVFAQLVDDPSSHPERFTTEQEQDAERRRLHAFMERLVAWENSSDVAIMKQARHEIEQSNAGMVPSLLDPFAGAGSIPLEAQRMGLTAIAADLNPVANIISRALIDAPPRFAGRRPVHPDSSFQVGSWAGSTGLAEDVRLYGKWMRDEAFKRIGHLYPTVTGPDGNERAVISWIWARTVRSPNPANPIETPLVNSWWLSRKKGKEAWITPTVVNGHVQYAVRRDPDGPKGAQDGTINRRGAVSVADGTPIGFQYIRSEAQAGRIGAHLIAIVAEDTRGRLYVSPKEEHRVAAQVPRSADAPTEKLPNAALGFRVQNYGMTSWADLFTNRQLEMMVTMSGLVGEVHERIKADAQASGMPEGHALEAGGTGAEAYADSVALFLALAVDKLADLNNSLTSWEPVAQCPRHLFTRPAVPMAWDYPEANPFSDSSGSFLKIVSGFTRVFPTLPSSIPGTAPGVVRNTDAATNDYAGVAVSTDPPYYDNIGYSNLSDFFYCWLRRSIGGFFPDAFATVLSPKMEEIVADPFRHDGKEAAEEFFVARFNRVFREIRSGGALAPITVYYAYKQQDSGVEGTAATGWHTLLEGLIRGGWEITATWPVLTEGVGRMRAHSSNALESTVLLACRPRPVDAEATTRRTFMSVLKEELPGALKNLMQGQIAPVDLAQAAIGPGISVFSRYSRVRDADGSDMSVRDALMAINGTLDEVLGEQESDFDPDTRFAVKWYRQYGWGQANSGIADQLARSSDTSIGGLERGGIFEAKGGKARLLSPSQLEDAWEPQADERVSVWEAAVRLAAVMTKDGADKVAELLPRVQTKVNLDAVKELGFLLFHEAEKKSAAKDAILFNGLVSAWGDLNEQARKYASGPRPSQQTFDFDDEV